MKKGSYILIAGIILGVWISFTYVNPFSGSITLTQLTLQMSGSRGEFPLGTSLFELLALTLRMVPFFLFQSFAGIKFYKHYCVASVYVFSRIPNRISWYMKQVGLIILWALLYQFLCMIAVTTTAILRYEVILDKYGIALFVFHFLASSLWIIFTTLAVNLLAVFCGSSTAFVWVAGIQTILVSAFSAIRYFSDLPLLQTIIIRSNPVSCLVLSWHTSKNEELNSILASPYQGMSLSHSIIILSVFCIATIIAGAVIVWRHDLIASDSETGGK